MERRIVQWIASQNMDSALVENSNDEDLLQAVQLCKEMQSSLCKENKSHVQPTCGSNFAPLNLSKLPTQRQQQLFPPPPSELSQAMPENRYESLAIASSRLYNGADTLAQFEYIPQVVTHTQSRENSAMCLNDIAILQDSQVQTENWRSTPYISYPSDGKSDANGYYDDLGFDLVFSQWHPHTFRMPQFEYPLYDNTI